MDNLFKSTEISYDFIKKMNNIIDNQYNDFKKQIIMNILQEVYLYNKLLKK